MNNLVDAVLQWWYGHQYDVYIEDEEEYNIYDEEPEFVKIAKKLDEIERETNK